MTQAKTTKKKDNPKKPATNSGRFTKGHKKVGGRKAGTPNKATRDARSILGETLLEHLERVDEYLSDIDDGAKKIDAISKLLPFYMPKYQSTTLSADTHRSLTCEEEMNELAQQFSKKEIEISITEREIFNFDDDSDL